MREFGFAQYVGIDKVVGLQEVRNWFNPGPSNPSISARKECHTQ